MPTLDQLCDAAQQHVLSRNNPTSPVDVANIFLSGVLDAAAGTGTRGSIFRGTPTVYCNSIGETGLPENIATEDLGRTYVEIINTSPSGKFWINFGADADNTANVAIPVAAGGVWASPPNWCPTGRVSIAGTASDTFTIITV